MKNYFIKKIVKLLMLDGKQTKAKQVVFNCFFTLKFQYRVNSIVVFMLALQNITPVVEFCSYKKGSKIVLLPKVTSYKRRLALGIRWLVEKVKKSKKKDSSKILALNLYESSQKKGEVYAKKMAIQKKVSLYKIIK